VSSPIYIPGEQEDYDRGQQAAEEAEHAGVAGDRLDGWAGPGTPAGQQACQQSQQCEIHVEHPAPGLGAAADAYQQDLQCDTK
jgi:hypothetical protein